MFCFDGIGDVCELNCCVLGEKGCGDVVVICWGILLGCI